MRNNVLSIWTEARIETLRRLWARGDFSCSGIAEEMGDGITRNAVIGKIHRLGLTGKIYGAIRTYIRRTPEQIEATRRAQNERRRERRRSQRVTIVKPPVNLEALRCVEVIPLGKTLLELGPNDCRYPYGDGPFTFCGQPQFKGSSYCGGHFGLTAIRGRS
jgi:GcrA cell cycle regulator